jgi:hypothetical protein
MGRRAPWTLTTAALAGAALACAGCGTGADQRHASAAAERFSAALARHDGEAACAQLSPDLRDQLVKDEPGSRCATSVQQLTVHGRRAARVRVYATSAMVELAHGDALFLDDTREGWRIAAVGCRPAGPGPYECEEQA